MHLPSNMISIFSAKQKGPLNPSIPQNGTLFPDMTGSQMLNGLSSPGTYTLSHSGGKVYQAIPLVTADQWSPSSSAALVYATMNPLSGHGEDFGTQSGGLVAIAGSCCNGDMHASTLPYLPRDRATSPFAAYFAGAAQLHPCEEPIWMGSQERLSDKHEVTLVLFLCVQARNHG